MQGLKPKPDQEQPPLPEHLKRDRYIRPKPDDRINKNHMTKYKEPENQINRKPDDQIICPVYHDIMGRFMI